MLRHFTTFRLFVASPGDVVDERERCVRAVDQFKRTSDNDLEVMVDFVRWETHPWPGFSEDAQAVINEQIEPFDVLVGIVWRRIGTPTGRSISGTVEEFKCAYDVWWMHRHPEILF